MVYSKASIVLALLLFTFVYTQTKALECYYCSSADADGTACNDPIDPSVNKAQCSVSKSIGKTFSALAQGKLQADGDAVCGSIKYRKGGKVITERGCAPKEIDNEETCQFIKEHVTSDIQVLDCSVCDSSLCNH